MQNLMFTAPAGRRFDASRKDSRWSIGQTALFVAFTSITLWIAIVGLAITFV